MDFSSVNDFLQKANSAKSQERQLIEDELDPFLSDPAIVGITSELFEYIDGLKQKYGDEAFRQIGIFCLAQWLEIHRETLNQHIQTETMDAALLTMDDISKLTLVIQILESIYSFGGDDDWKRMLKDIAGRTLLESFEENGIDPVSFLNRRKK
jgi:TRAP-type C4-dicarboxylate transport system substrate-binding protein